jgi:hypothetical protein
MIETLFGISYPGSVDGYLYRYNVRDAGDCGMEAIVYSVKPGGLSTYIGQVNLSHCETVAAQQATVKSWVEGYVYS